MKFTFYISTELEKNGGSPKKILKSVNHATILIDLENIMKIHFTPKDIFSARGLDMGNGFWKWLNYFLFKNGRFLIEK